MQIKRKDKDAGVPLPLNRLSQYFDIVRYHFADVIAVSLLACLFLVPSLLWLVFVSFSDLVDLGNLYSILAVYGVLAVLFSITGLGSVGAAYYFRKLAYAEGASLPGDFFLGIKKNFKNGLASHFVLGLLYLILKLDTGALGSLELDASWFYALMGLSYALFYVLASLILFYIPQCVLYEGGFIRLLGNSLRFYVGSFLESLPISLVFFLPFFLFDLIEISLSQWIILCLFFFYYGFALLADSLYCTYLFDRFVNPRYYPELVNKGLRKN